MYPTRCCGERERERNIPYTLLHFVLFYFLLFSSILVNFILFYSILFYSVLFHNSIQFTNVRFYSILVCTWVQTTMFSSFINHSYMLNIASNIFLDLPVFITFYSTWFFLTNLHFYPSIFSLNIFIQSYFWKSSFRCLEFSNLSLRNNPKDSLSRHHLTWNNVSVILSATLH